MATGDPSDGLVRIVVVVLGVVVLFPLLMMVFAMPMMGMMGWWWNGGMMNGGLSPMWGIGMMLLWLAVLVAVGYLLYRGLVGRVEDGTVADPALAELRMAYARGDLSEDEYDERRERLQREG